MTQAKKRIQIDKPRLGLALAIAATCALTFCFFSVTEVFAGNRAELLFNFRDFAPWILLITLGVTLVLLALIYLPGQKTGRYIAAVFVWLTLMGYVQSTFLNGAAGLAGDDKEGFETGLPAVINLLIWILVLAAILFAVFRVKAKENLETAAVILMLMLLGMQTVGFVTNLPRITMDRFAAEAQADKGGDGKDVMQEASYLSTDGMMDTASKSNIYVIILDRLDVSFIDSIQQKDRDFFAPLGGFTYYRDNTSLYSRTFPGAATIIAGQDGDLTGPNAEFFRKIYSTSPLLQDLKENGYRVRLYAPSYYTYRSGSVFEGIADNLASYTGYTMTRPLELTGNLLLLSLYKAVPQLLKPLIAISTESFDSFVEYNYSSPQASWDERGFYTSLLQSGLKDGGFEKAYTYLHFHGGHDPFILDENANEVEKSSGTAQVMGDFRILYTMFDRLKQMGLYEQSTIIITGDHPRALSDTKDPAEPRLTALFVKEAGRGEEPFVVSEAQVSQENFAATIIRSAGIPTDHDYGEAYSEVPVGEDQVRYHQFQLSKDGDCFIMRFRVTGEGADFKNWEIESRTNIGKLYQ